MQSVATNTVSIFKLLIFTAECRVAWSDRSIVEKLLIK